MTIPMEWIDKLFSCMAEFYGEKWTKQFANSHKESTFKTIWRNGLYGLTYDEIKKALILCKKASVSKGSYPPHVTEFFQFAKGREAPFIAPIQLDDYRRNTEIQKNAMQEIKKKLSMK